MSFIFLIIAVVNFAYGALLQNRVQDWSPEVAEVNEDAQRLVGRPKVHWRDDSGEQFNSGVSFLAPVFMQPVKLLVNYERQRVHVVGTEKVFFALGSLALVIQILSLFA